MQLKLEENEIEMNSLKTGLKLMDIYKKCFGDYNKFLINGIKKEQKLLNDYNAYKKSLEDQVNILQKKFNDIIFHPFAAGMGGERPGGQVMEPQTAQVCP